MSGASGGSEQAKVALGLLRDCPCRESVPSRKTGTARGDRSKRVLLAALPGVGERGGSGRRRLRLVGGCRSA